MVPRTARRWCTGRTWTPSTRKTACTPSRGRAGDLAALPVGDLRRSRALRQVPDVAGQGQGGGQFHPGRAAGQPPRLRVADPHRAVRRRPARRPGPGRQQGPGRAGAARTPARRRRGGTRPRRPGPTRRARIRRPQQGTDVLGGVAGPVDPAQPLQGNATGGELARLPRAQAGREPPHRLAHRAARRVGQLAAVHVALGHARRDAEGRLRPTGPESSSPTACSTVTAQLSAPRCSAQSSEAGPRSPGGPGCTIRQGTACQMSAGIAVVSIGAMQKFEPRRRAGPPPPGPNTASRTSRSPQAASTTSSSAPRRPAGRARAGRGC